MSDLNINSENKGVNSEEYSVLATSYNNNCNIVHNMSTILSFLICVATLFMRQWPLALDLKTGMFIAVLSFCFMQMISCLSYYKRCNAYICYKVANRKKHERSEFKVEILSGMSINFFILALLTFLIYSVMYY